MDQHMLKRLLRLAQKTGSPVILTDQQGSEPSVLMPLDTYEAMVDGLVFAEGRFDEEDSGEFDEYEEGTGDVPLQEIDQDLPFSEEEEEEVPEDFTMEDVPFDPPMEEPAQQPIQSTEDGFEERFYLEPIE